MHEEKEPNEGVEAMREDTALEGMERAQEDIGPEGAEDMPPAAPDEKKRVNPLELAEQKIRQKEAKLAESKNRLADRKRKARNGQLYVWGAMVEAAYSRGSEADRTTIRAWADEYLTEKRHRERSDFGIFRLDKERENAPGE